MPLGQAAAQTMIDNLAEKTGRSLDQWLKLLARQKLEKHGEIDLVGAQYEGAKSGLRPIYEAVIKIVSGFGKDVEIAPKSEVDAAFLRNDDQIRQSLGAPVAGSRINGRPKRVS